MTAASLRITQTIISPYSSTPPPSLYQFRVNNDGCFTQNHSDNHISLLSLHTTNHLTSLESIMTAASLRITQTIISPCSSTPPPPNHSTSLESKMTAASLRITQTIISPYSSTPPPPDHSTSLESIMTAASLRITQTIISPYSSTPPPPITLPVKSQ